MLPDNAAIDPYIYLQRALGYRAVVSAVDLLMPPAAASSQHLPLSAAPCAGAAGEARRCSTTLAPNAALGLIRPRTVALAATRAPRATAARDIYIKSVPLDVGLPIGNPARCDTSHTTRCDVDI
eukprot:5790019-Pleurochrysis_carterae.AAC.5